MSNARKIKDEKAAKDAKDAKDAKKVKGLTFIHFCLYPFLFFFWYRESQIKLKPRKKKKIFEVFMSVEKQPLSLVVGKIVRAHGLQGHVVIHSFCANPENLKNYSLKLATDFGHSTKTCISILRLISEHTLTASIEGIHDRTLAEGLIGHQVVAYDLPDLPSDEFYLGQLKDLTVMAQGQKIGYVLGAEDYGAGCFLTIEKQDRSIATLPFTKENLIRIDLSERMIEIDEKCLIQ